jgi:hypothetical protein
MGLTCQRKDEDGLGPQEMRLGLGRQSLLVLGRAHLPDDTVSLRDLPHPAASFCDGLRSIHPATPTAGLFSTWAAAGRPPPPCGSRPCLPSPAVYFCWGELPSYSCEAVTHRRRSLRRILHSPPTAPCVGK